MNQQMIEALQGIVGKAYVLTAKEDLLTYAYDATADLPNREPEAVVIPQNKTQIQAIVRLAKEAHFPIYTRGSGTNLCGATIPLRGGIVLLMVRMDAILEVDLENLTATVEPGVIMQSLNQRVEACGLIYPPDPGTVATATMGGSVSQCSGGLRGLKYGVTKDYVLGLEVVLANGELIRMGGKTVKNVAGYDLTKLFTGAEGTLGVITEITVKLIPAPKYRRNLLAGFADLDQAGSAISEIIRQMVVPATLEIMDQLTMEMVENYLSIGLPTHLAAVLLIELDGNSEEGVLAELAVVEQICRDLEARELRIAHNDLERDQIMAARRAALPALARVKPTTILEDATVPRSKIPEMLKALRGIGEKYQLQIGTFGHAGDGNLHPTILIDERDHLEMARVRQAVDEIFQVALALGGTLSGEHGIGIAKAKYMEMQFGVEGLATMRRIKEAFDPEYCFNPDHFFGGV